VAGGQEIKPFLPTYHKRVSLTFGNQGGIHKDWAKGAPNLYKPSPLTPKISIP